MAITGIVFDKDGTLFDYNKTWCAFADEVLQVLAPDNASTQSALGNAVGYDPLSRQFVPGSPIVAGSVTETCEIWTNMLEGWSLSALEELTNARAVAAPAVAATDLRLLNSKLISGGCALGVATHDSEQAAIAQLSQENVLDQYAMVIGYDSGFGLKPGPGMIDAFCDKTGLLQSHTAMVGDSRHDLDAGRAAGCGLVIGVLTGPATHDDLAPYADVVLPSIAQIPDLIAKA